MTTEVTPKDCFLALVRSERAAWDALVASIPDERLCEAGAVGHWSVKDTIAHITVYERWTVEWLEPALNGDPPTWDYPDDEDSRSLDDRNARFFQQNRERSLEDIQSEAAGVHARLLSALERIPADAFEKDIQDFAPEVGAYYDTGTTVAAAIDANAAEHYRGHTEDVRGWLTG
jgi:uncharacterized damage-inducible protein DinB